MKVGWMGLACVALSASMGWAQVTLPQVPTAPVTICVKQNLPSADSWTLSVDGGASQAVTLASPADTAKCATSDSHSFTVAPAAFTVGTHTLRLTAIKGTKTKLGPIFTVIVDSPAPGDPVITSVVAGAVPSQPGATLATFGLTAGSATFGLALPQGASSTAVRVGALATQTDVKTRWSDGSIRFAVVSASVPSAGQYAVTAGAATSGAVTPTWPSVSVTFNISGAAWVAALPAFNGADSWLAGSVVREARVMVEPRNGSTDHPLLQVIYDVRSYASGGHRIDVTVQNVRDITAGDVVTYDVSVSIGGQAVFARSGVRQNYLTRWRKVFTTGGLTEAAVTPDVEPFYTSKAIPRFHPQVVNQTYPALIDAPCPADPQAKCFDILRYGDMPSYMGMPGGRADLAPYPNWTVQYLVHKQPAARAWMLKHADLSGSYTGHITKADGRFVTLDEMPNYWLDGRAGTNPHGPNATRKADGFLQGWGDALETAHMPSLTFVPYLLTGDRFYLDQQKFWANFALLATWPGDGSRSANGAKGILYQNQPRGYGWGLRVLGEMTAFLPDDDPYRSYYRARTDENIVFADRRPIDDPGGPLGVPFTKRFGIDAEGYAATSMWQVSYIAYAVDRLRQLGWTQGAAFLKQAAAFQVRLFTSAPDFPPIYGAPYYPKVGRWTGTGSAATVTEWFTMAQIFAVNYKSGAEPPQPLTGYYGPETRILLLIAQAQGIPKADEALAFLSTQPGVMSDIYGRSGWAIASVGAR